MPRNVRALAVLLAAASLTLAGVPGSAQPEPTTAPTTAAPTTAAPSTAAPTGTAPTPTVTSTTVTNPATTSTTATATATSTTAPAPTTSPTAPDARSSPPAEPLRWTVRFGGDSLLTRRVGAETDPFAAIRPSLAAADLAIVNAETAIGTSGRAAIKTYTFQSPPVFARMMATAGVDIASLANNHSLDFGVGALDETIRNLRAAGVSPVGAGRNRAEALLPVSRTVHGVRVAVLAASQIIPGPDWVAGDGRPGISSAGKHVIDANTQHVVRAVAAARASHDVVLVIMHWGIEGDPCPSGVQRQLARLLRAAGATAVLGAHPHVLQPIVAGGKGADAGLVAYSMGNFIWDPRAGASADTGVIELVFDGPRLTAHRFYPHRLNGNGWADAVDPQSAAGKRITDRVRRACPGASGLA